MRGEKEGMAVGFFSGLLMDIFFGQLFGFYSLLYLFLGYGSGLFHRMFYDEDIKLPMIWIALSELVYGLSVYFFLFLMRSKFHFGFYFTNIILPGLVYTVVVTILFYRVIRSLNHWLEQKEKEEGESRKISPVIPYNDNDGRGQTDSKTEE